MKNKLTLSENGTRQVKTENNDFASGETLNVLPASTFSSETVHGWPEEQVQQY